MVAGGPHLVAIIGEGKYPLRAAGVDTFINIKSPVNDLMARVLLPALIETSQNRDRLSH